MKESPFLTHKEILLNRYGTARVLHNITLSLWNGNKWPADLSRVDGLDERHFAIALELITWYHQHGERDQDFVDTGRACEALAVEGKRQAEQQEAYYNWERLVNRALSVRGKDSALTFDNYEWFFDRFERGLTPDQAAEQAINSGLGIVEKKQHRFNSFCLFALELVRKIGFVTFVFLIGSGLGCFAILWVDVEQPVTNFDWLFSVFAWFFVVTGIIGVCVHIHDMMRKLRRRE